MEANENIHVRGRHFHCSLCDIKMTSSKAVEAHLNGKKHQRLLDLKACRQKQADKSIFVGGLNKLMSELLLTDYFMKFGDVSKVIIDKNQGQYAIVEFNDNESVLRATEQEKQTLQGTKVTVRPREHKPFAFHHRESTGEQGSSGSGVQGNRYGTIPAELQKAILLRLSPAENVSDQMKQLVSLLELPSSALRLRYLICSLLEEVFREFFPSCQVYPFGSSVNGFGIQGSDLDLHLELEASGFEYKFAKFSGATSTTEEEGTSMETNSEETTKQDKDDMEIDINTASPEDIMDLVCKVLRSCVPSCKAVKPILHARRPVVKFQHKESRLYCDISMSNRLAVRNTELLNYYANLDERVRPLVYCIRHWGKVRHIAGNPRAGPRLTNYALSLMVVYYLQTISPPVLPTVDQLRDEKGTADIIEGWECNFSKKENSMTNTESSVELLRGFFHFYSTFDFTTNVISLKTGTSLPISTFTAPESPVYKDQSFKLGPLNIQDPFELSHNVAFNVNEKIAQSLCKQVKKAYTLCLCLKFKKKPVESSDVMSVWGLPVLFDAQSYVDAVPKRVKSESTSTEGSVPEETSPMHSIVVCMKASQLSEAFVKSHSTTDALRSAWCDATMALIKKILSEVLKIQFNEITSDDVITKTSESSPVTSALTSYSKEDHSSSVMDVGGSVEESGPGDQKVPVQTDAQNEELLASSASKTDGHNMLSITNAGDHGDDKYISQIPEVGCKRTETQCEVTEFKTESHKHPLDGDDGEMEEIAPRKKIKLGVTSNQTNAGTALKPESNDESDVTSINKKVLSGQDLKMSTVAKQSDTCPFHFNCSISHQVWLGRRKVRRQLNQSEQTAPSSPSDKTALTFEDRLQIETLVTNHIIAQDSLSKSLPLTKFKLMMQQGGEAGQCQINVGFQPVEGLAHFKNLFHFLQTFLVKLTEQHTM